jgi:hypothetical protein
MIALALTLALAGQTSPAPDRVTVDPLVVESGKGALPLVPTDKAIADGLNALLKTEPERVVCISRARLGTHLPRPECATLRAWFDLAATRDVPARVVDLGGPRGGGAPGPGGLLEPPHELLDLIKARYRDRAVAEASRPTN